MENIPETGRVQGAEFLKDLSKYVTSGSFLKNSAKPAAKKGRQAQCVLDCAYLRWNGVGEEMLLWCEQRAANGVGALSS